MPEAFVEYAFRQRVRLIREMASGRVGPGTLLGFTRHNPAIITCGPAGPNGSIKGIGFIHREEVLEETLERMREELARPFDPRRAAEFLLGEIYVEDKIDFGKLTTLELAKGHTWRNLTSGGPARATILFFTPPETSYELRCDVEIHESGPIWEFVNSVHDLFHRPSKPRDWKKTPAYLFKIREIYDNGAEAMGVRIL